MPKRRSSLLLALTILFGVSCGRIGVELLDEPRAEPADMLDASAPDPGDAAIGCRLGTADGEIVVPTGEAGKLSGAYQLTLVETGLCAAPAGCLFDHGGTVAQASCDTSPCQTWEAVDQGAGWFALRNAKLGACLYMSGPSAGLKTISWECVSTDKISWQALCVGNDEWQLNSKPSNLPIGGDGNAAPNAGIVQGTDGSAQQRWRIAPATNKFNVVMTTGESDPAAIWRYTTTAPASSWSQPTFDDSTWTMGPGAFGDTDRGFTPSRTRWTSNDIWLRRSFNLATVPIVMSVKIFHDELAEVYVNDVPVTMLTGWSQGYRTLDLPAPALSALRVGSNTIAVHCRNTSAPQIIDVGLGSYLLP